MRDWVFGPLSRYMFLLLCAYTSLVVLAAGAWALYETSHNVHKMTIAFEAYKDTSEKARDECIQTLTKCTDLLEESGSGLQEATRMLQQCESNLRFCVTRGSP